MLVFAGITPHPPILIESIGKENLEKIKKTREALLQLEEEIYTAKTEIIIVISPHGEVQPDYFTVNLSPNFEGDFKEFGDFVTKLSFKGNSQFAHQIKTEAENKIPVTLISSPTIDHGSLVPLYYLTRHLPNITVVPISFSLLDFNKHLLFGQILKRACVKSNKRIAIVASGDLSHRLTKNAPAGYSPVGKVFDKKLIRAIETKKTDEIFAFDDKFIEQAGECGLRSFLILLGALSKINYQPELLSYEGPFGVGYLVMNFVLR
ncbi:MAG: AmmeMemoRadiSam system protein B [bacterium]